MTFTKHLANGKDKVFVLNPTVNPYQDSTTLQHLTLGDKRDQYIFDGTTRFSYQLLPFATVNIQFEYTKITNFVFGSPSLVKEVVRVNKERNAKEDYLSTIAKEYTIGKNVVEMIKAKVKTKSATPVVKPGAKKIATPNAKIRSRQKAKLRESGSIDDALGLILNS